MAASWTSQGFPRVNEWVKSGSLGQGKAMNVPIDRKSPIERENKGMKKGLPSSDTDPYRFAVRKKFLLMLAVLVGAVAALHFSGLRRYIGDVQELKGYLDATGGWAPFLFVAGSTLFIAVGTPRLLFCSIGGLFFGFAEGLALGQVASLLGSYAVFLFARWGGGEWMARQAAERPRIAGLLASPSVATVFVVRQLPVYGLITNVLLGMAVVPHGAFLIGSFLGFLPSAVAATLIGSGLGKDSLLLSTVQVVSAVAVLAVSAAFVVKIRRKYQAGE